jgi:SAM-dependent methyltransferase
MADQKNYWENRAVSPGNRFGQLLKRSRPTRALTNILFSVRASDEIFVSDELRRRDAQSVLDVACGGGKAVIPSIARHVTGVDIAGFPAHEALAKGYGECVEYHPPDYHFSVSRPIDAVTAINLNAHIPADSYRTILRRAVETLRPGGILILVHEYDNHGLSYRWMRRDRRKFDRMVEGMEHWHFEFEARFMATVPELGDLDLVRRRPLTGGLLPSVHYYGYIRERDPGPLARKALLLADVPISLINYAQCRLTTAFNKSFLVGYVFEKRA